MEPPLAPAAVERRESFRLVDGSVPLPDDLAGSVMLLGNFDGFHRGHAALLETARALPRAGVLSVMSVEPHPRQFFAPDSAPFRLFSARTKRECFARAGFSFAYEPRFDAAFAGQGAEEFVEDVLVRRLRVAHLVVGEDFRFGRRRQGDVDLLRAMGEALGFGVKAVAPVRRQEIVCSSSLVRQLLRAGDVASANALLAEPWRVETCVTDRQGERFELRWPPEMICLPEGIYRARLNDMQDISSPMMQGRATIEGGRVFFTPEGFLSRLALAATTASTPLFLSFTDMA